MRVLTSCVLALVTLATLGAATPGHAKNPSLKALEKWLTEAGFDSVYGLRPEDRPAANEAINKLKSTPVELMRWPRGEGFEWRSHRKLNVPHQRCALAAMMDAVSLWMSMNAFEMRARPFHVYVECESRAWAKVSFELATEPDAFDVMTFEASYIRKGEAPFRMKPSEVKRADSGPYGIEHEVTLLAQQSYRELGALESPVSAIHISRDRLPGGGTDCTPVSDLFDGLSELCARRIDTTDERLVASTALMHYLEGLQRRWEQGEYREGLAPIGVFVYGKDHRRASVRPLDKEHLEVAWAKSRYEVRREKVAVPRRFLAKAATLPPEAPKARPPAPAADLASKLTWLGSRAPFIVFALTGDGERAKTAGLDLAKLLEHLGPPTKTDDSWVSCTPKSRTSPKHCELKPRVEALKIGPATDKDAQMGPIVSR
ncbi:MAG TPA: hypothetical protein PK095_13480, partial [Myxococcota bacterium]|nr:hypothetical protein [Myxococcota bacterium]